MSLDINKLKKYLVGRRIDDIVLAALEGADVNDPHQSMPVLVLKDPLGETVNIVLKPIVEVVVVPPGRQAVTTAKIMFLVKHGEVAEEEFYDGSSDDGNGADHPEGTA